MESQNIYYTQEKERKSQRMTKQKLKTDLLGSQMGIEKSNRNKKVGFRADDVYFTVLERERIDSEKLFSM